MLPFEIQLQKTVQPYLISLSVSGGTSLSPFHSPSFHSTRPAVLDQCKPTLYWSGYSTGKLVHVLMPASSAHKEVQMHFMACLQPSWVSAMDLHQPKSGLGLSPQSTRYVNIASNISLLLTTHYYCLLQLGKPHSRNNGKNCSLTENALRLLVHVGT